MFNNLLEESPALQAKIKSIDQEGLVKIEFNQEILKPNNLDSWNICYKTEYI